MPSHYLWLSVSFAWVALIGALLEILPKSLRIASVFKTYESRLIEEKWEKMCFYVTLINLWPGSNCKTIHRWEIGADNSKLWTLTVWDYIIAWITQPPVYHMLPWEILGNQVHISVSIILVIQVVCWTGLLFLAPKVDFIPWAVWLEFLSCIALLEAPWNFSFFSFPSGYCCHHQMGNT